VDPNLFLYMLFVDFENNTCRLCSETKTYFCPTRKLSGGKGCWDSYFVSLCRIYKIGSFIHPVSYNIITIPNIMFVVWINNTAFLHNTNANYPQAFQTNFIPLFLYFFLYMLFVDFENNTCRLCSETKAYFCPTRKLSGGKGCWDSYFVSPPNKIIIQSFFIFT
jgi:hypothetical protein